jgi:sec-independent protein translocase protein TatB
MFDIGWSELLVIGVVALIAIGPKELPGVLRSVGQWMTKIRRMAAEFQGQFQEAMREAEMADLKKQAEELNDAARNLTTNFDPFDYVAKDEAKPAQPAATADAGASTDASSASASVADQSAAATPSAPTVEPVTVPPAPSPEPATAPPAPDTPAAPDSAAPSAGGRAA